MRNVPTTWHGTDEAWPEWFGNYLPDEFAMALLALGDEGNPVPTWSMAHQYAGNQVTDLGTLEMLADLLRAGLLQTGVVYVCPACDTVHPILGGGERYHVAGCIYSRYVPQQPVAMTT